MFAEGAARLVIGAQMPRDRAAMHLDTVFTFCDRDVVTLYEPVVVANLPDPVPAEATRGVTGRGLEAIVPRRAPHALGIEDWKIVTTGGDEFEAERNQWDDGNNVVALEPRRRRRLRAQRGNDPKLAKAGVEVLAISGSGTRTRTRRRPLHDLPRRPRA